MDLLGRGGEVSTRRTPLRGLDTRLTAHAALDLVERAALERDPNARLRLILSSEDMDATGRAGLWEFQWDLPARYASATIRIGVDPDSDGEDESVMVEQVHPFVPPGDLWDLLRESEETLRRTLATHWQRHLSGRPALDGRGYDSPHALATLLRRGATLGSGSYLGARVQVAGDSVWYLHADEQFYSTPFGPPALPPGTAAPQLGHGGR